MTLTLLVYDPEAGTCIISILRRTEAVKMKLLRPLGATYFMITCKMKTSLKRNYY